VGAVEVRQVAPLAAAMAALAMSACPPPSDEPAPLPPRFTDVTEAWGVEFAAPWPTVEPESYPWTRAGGGGVLDDLDGDGDLDLLLTAPFGAGALLLNEGDRFEPASTGAGFEELTGVLDATAADLDGDDLPDLLVCQGRLVRRYRNLGGQFEELEPLVETAEEVRPVGTTVADVDGDGHPDVFVMTWGVSEDFGLDPVHGRDRFFLGRGDGSFDEASGIFGDAGGLSFSASWLDLEPDGDLDLLVVKYDALQMGGNALFVRRDGELAFDERAAEHGVDATSNGMGVDVADLEGDGALEVAISDTDYRVVILSLREFGAIDVAASLGAVPSDIEDQRDSWGVRFEDVDDDGDVDLLTPWGNKDVDPSYPDQRNSLWLWNGAAFDDATDAALPPLMCHAWRSVLPGDLDGDGALDLVWTSAVGPVSIQLGRPTGNHHLAVALPSGRGQGARVEVDGQSRIVAAGAGGLHASLPPIVRFGLGAKEEAARVRVFWPDGTVTERTSVPADQTLTLW
jgi:hypothetical protein